MNYPLFVSCAKGLEYLLEDELKPLGLHVTRISPQGVYGDASLKTLYQICLWSRLAQRVQLILFRGKAPDSKALYQLCLQYPWKNVFSVNKTLAVTFHGTSDALRNAMYAAQVVKDGIVDYFQNLDSKRPSVDREHAHVNIQAHLKYDTVTVSLDLTGYSLHQRGYRQKAGKAPLKETLACAMLMRAKWPEWAQKGEAFLDPFCGAGTLAIEAALIASHTAPGLLRDDQAFVHWKGHDEALWATCRKAALASITPPQSLIKGSDADAHVVAIANENAKKAGVSEWVRFVAEPLDNVIPEAPEGLIVCNPPYGERMGDASACVPLYQQLGQHLHTHFMHWKAAVLTSNPLLAKALGLRSEKHYTLYNGALECKLYTLSLSPDNQLKHSEPGQLSEGSRMLTNRLKKNKAHLSKWAKKREISCYRLYDADLPEYAFAVDCYLDHVVVQEYAAPETIALHKAEQRRLEMLHVLPEVLQLPRERLIVKTRQPQKGKAQYEKVAKTNETLVVNEGKALFKVNVNDYLDTGLFLDHRPLRLQFGELRKATRFLNLFCYTATASVHAALAGAYTTNVDLSNTYLQWAMDNFKLNRIDVSRHQFIAYDCLKWLSLCRDRFNVIFLDPPSFSNSKRMEGVLDIQRDHPLLIDLAMKLLTTDGVLYFSTNRRKFKLDNTLLQTFAIQDISKKTIDEDFKNNPSIHRCYTIRHQHAPTASVSS